MLARLRRHLEETGLIPPGTRVLVGYSGGADSTCLLHLLHALEIEVIGAHLHHGQRVEADEELKQCEAFCEALGVPFLSGKADIPKMSTDLKVGLEEAGRLARYNFFEQAASRTECALIATAHTRTDHVETVLLNLVRGAGANGLSGIAMRRGRIIRPILIFNRQETLDYCRKLDLWTHDDPANSNIDFSRARIRHRVIPELEAINPNVEEAIARAADLLNEEDRFLNGAAAAALEQCERPRNGELSFLTQDCEVYYDRSLLAHLPSVLLCRAIRLAADVIGGPLNYSQTKLVEAALREEGSGSVTAEGGNVVVEWDAETLGIRQLQPTTPYRYPLTFPGETESLEFGWRLVAYEGDGTQAAQKRSTYHAILNPNSIKGKLFFRTLETGDTIEPYGFEHSRKVSDLMSEFGLTLAARHRMPIICDMVGPIWIPGICLANRVKLTELETKAIHIEFGPMEMGQALRSETIKSDST